MPELSKEEKEKLLEKLYGKSTKKELIVVALGGNAIKQADEKGTAEEQFRNVRNTAKLLVELSLKGYKLVITHGNGPQAGALLIQQEEGKRMGIPAQPLDVVGAMTQGQIGYMLQQCLVNEFRKRGITNVPIITVVTQVLVHKDDPDFQDPSKPVGPFYTKEEALKYAKERGWIVKQVKPGEGKTWRRVVPSPDPIGQVEAEAIRRLVDARVIVIASGGGGIPVIDENSELKGVEAVIDKDLAGERLAELVDADIFLILTDVEKAKLNFGKPNEKDIDVMTVSEAKKYYEEGHFLKGSMGPKVLACIRFLEAGGKRAIITHLEKAVEAIEGKTGTHIIPDPK
ncbi:MAG: carbamate kinase [Candidatus Asgardarchaeia archaeon]|nr:carbamate kinase [Candidatus Odinarchaeota archaeon]